MQYFDHYHIYSLVPDPTTLAAGIDETALLLASQGSQWVSAQAYLDLYASKRLKIGRGHEISLDLGIVNLLNSAPPRESWTRQRS